MVRGGRSGGEEDLSIHDRARAAVGARPGYKAVSTQEMLAWDPDVASRSPPPRRLSLLPIRSSGPWNSWTPRTERRWNRRHVCTETRGASMLSVKPDVARLIAMDGVDTGEIWRHQIPEAVMVQHAKEAVVVCHLN